MGRIKSLLFAYPPSLTSHLAYGQRKQTPDTGQLDAANHTPKKTAVHAGLSQRCRSLKRTTIMITITGGVVNQKSEKLLAKKLLVICD